VSARIEDSRNLVADALLTAETVRDVAVALINTMEEVMGAAEALLAATDPGLDEAAAPRPLFRSGE